MSKVWFNSNVFLLIFCLDDLPIADSGLQKSPTSIVLLSVSPFFLIRLVSLCLLVEFSPFTFRVILICKDLLLPPYLSSGCFISLLLLFPSPSAYICTLVVFYGGMLCLPCFLCFVNLFFNFCFWLP